METPETEHIQEGHEINLDLYSDILPPNKYEAG